MSPAHSREARQEWQPIETAPTHEEVLVYREDAGVMLSIYTTCADQGWPSEKEMDEMDEETLWQMDWWWFGPHGVCRMDGSEVPTHWMPLPSEPSDLTEGEEAKPCARCGGTGVVDDGEIGFYEGTGIPYENGPIKCVKDCPACK